ncbi:TlpA family protein disulfide reductase [Mucilaginibacter paludis]|uniref:Alkyl hydroperoxide reductase/ Thiol specific antioxidant/ Mal allergen n=1 Tax=Mucilaginibacter paludis DSM 18603 TaxID=714943 RepID=H1YE53_9SPHI|nr:TlpA disulfide reductase family protein [Mucilaginibacter paludis]EHQ25231.1 alkyl hydroperoxide reductase/ Thiol specific antioxidant/ Mal allergen [Mucilaginibacter paludis DSM 18603]
MLKATIITAVSISAMLFSGYIKNAPVRDKNEHLTTSYSLRANKGILNADTTLLKVGDKCPDFIFRDTTGYDGRNVKLSAFKGKYVLIDVWASWCAPCRAQYPHLVTLEEKMKNKAITFVSISIDTRIFRWKGPVLSKMGGIQWMVRDETFEKAFGINMIPRFILLDKKGNVLSLKMPLPSHPELEQELNKLKGI